MKVVFVQNVQNLGRKGEVKDVKSGYAINYLLPQKLAVTATAKNIDKYSRLFERERVAKKGLQQAPSNLAKKLKGVVLDFAEKADENGTFFAGITRDKIATGLKARKLAVKAKQVLLNDPIKKEGSQMVKVEVAPGQIVEIKVVTSSKK